MKVSVVIPTKNGARTLPQLLAAIRDQSLASEIVAVDSGSTDGTRELLRERADRLIEIDPTTFNHGETRNLAIAASSGDAVVLTVQDALPVARTWLETLVRPLHEQTVAGSFARQQPLTDASTLSRLYLDSYLATSATAFRSRISPDEFARLSPMERLTRCTFDNVCACVKRSVWERHRFARVTIAEDLVWAKAVLLAGYEIVYVPDAVVRHSHERSAWYEFKRTYLVHEQLQALFGLRTIATTPALGVGIASCLRSHCRSLGSAVLAGDRRATKELPRALLLALALPSAQYLGSRSLARDFLPLWNV